VRFVDTNVLLYAVSRAPDEAVKTGIALTLLDSPDLAVSVQVLQEFYVQATRASRKDGMSAESASALIEAWLRFPTQEMSVTLMRAGLATAARHHLSYWDSTIVEAARMLGCQTVLSEDLSHGQDFDGVRVVNPFLDPR
jgi:predicted nucleic acid-binding protein